MRKYKFKNFFINLIGFLDYTCFCFRDRLGITVWVQQILNISEALADKILFFCGLSILVIEYFVSEHINWNLIYKRCPKKTDSLVEPEYFGEIVLDPENEWLQLAKLIPWQRIEEEYASSFTSRIGQPACSFRMALGSLLIKKRYHFSDKETVEHITMNPYFQYFIGLEAFSQKSPIDQSMMTRVRKKIRMNTLKEVGEIIIMEKPAEEAK